MSGETENAARISALRKRLSQNRSTDKYYASGDTNVPIASSSGNHEGVRNPGDVPIVRRATPLNERSTDKYYAAQKQAPTAQQIARDAQKGKSGRKVRMLPPDMAAVPIGGAPSSSDKQQATRLTALTKEDIPHVVSRVESVLRETEDIVVLTAPRELMARLRSAVDLLVTQERITEDRYRDVRFNVQNLQASSPNDAIRPTVSLDVPDDIDPEAFMAADNPESLEKEVDVTPQNIVDDSHTTAGDVGSGDTADDEDDFLVSKPEEQPVAATEQPSPAEPESDPVTAPTETNIEPPTVVDAPQEQPPEEDQQPESFTTSNEHRKGRKHGRGSK